LHDLSYTKIKIKNAGLSGDDMGSYILSKETYILSKEPYIHTWAQRRIFKPYFLSKEP